MNTNEEATPVPESSDLDFSDLNPPSDAPAFSDPSLENNNLSARDGKTPLTGPVRIKLARASLTPTEHRSRAERPNRTGIYFECPKHLINALDKKLTTMNRRHTGYTITKRDLFVNFLINWLAEPVVVVRASQLDATGNFINTASPEETPALAPPSSTLGADSTPRNLHEIDSSEVGGRTYHQSEEMTQFLADGGSVLELLEGQHTIPDIVSPLLPDKLINDELFNDQDALYNTPESAITSDRLGNNLNLTNLDKNLIRLRKYKRVELIAIPAGHVQKLFDAAFEVINLPAGLEYTDQPEFLDEGGNFFNKKGQVYDELTNKYLETLGSTTWTHTIWRAWLRGWRPKIWTPRFDWVISDAKGLISPVSLKEALKQPIDVQSWTDNYLTITAFPMDNPVALDSFVKGMEEVKDEMFRQANWSSYRGNPRPTTSSHEQFTYPDFILKDRKS